MKGNRIGVSIGWKSISKRDIREERNSVTKTDHLSTTIRDMLRGKGLYVSELYIQKGLRGESRVSEGVTTPTENYGVPVESGTVGQYRGADSAIRAQWLKAETYKQIKGPKAEGASRKGRKARGKKLWKLTPAERRARRVAELKRIKAAKALRYIQGDRVGKVIALTQVGEPIVGGSRAYIPEKEVVKVSGFVVKPELNYRGKEQIMKQLIWLIKWLRLELYSETLRASSKGFRSGFSSITESSAKAQAIVKKLEGLALSPAHKRRIRAAFKKFNWERNHKPKFKRAGKWAPFSHPRSGKASEWKGKGQGSYRKNTFSNIKVDKSQANERGGSPVLQGAGAVSSRRSGKMNIIGKRWASTKAKGRRRYKNSLRRQGKQKLVFKRLHRVCKEVLPVLRGDTVSSGDRASLFPIKAQLKRILRICRYGMGAGKRRTTQIAGVISQGPALMIPNKAEVWEKKRKKVRIASVKGKILLLRYFRKSLKRLRKGLKRRLGRRKSRGAIRWRVAIRDKECRNLLRLFKRWATVTRKGLNRLREGRLRPGKVSFKPWLRFMGKSKAVSAGVGKGGADKRGVKSASKMVGPVVRNSRVAADGYDIEEILKEVGLMIERLYNYKIVWDVHTSLRFTHHAATIKQWLESQIKRGRLTKGYGDGVVTDLNYKTLPLKVYRRLHYKFRMNRIMRNVGRLAPQIIAPKTPSDKYKVIRRFKGRYHKFGSAFSKYKQNNYKQNNYKQNNYKQNSYKQNNYKQNNYKQNNYKQNNYNQNNYNQNNYNQNNYQSKPAHNKYKSYKSNF